MIRWEVCSEAVEKRRRGPRRDRWAGDARAGGAMVATTAGDGSGAGGAPAMRSPLTATPFLWTLRPDRAARRHAWPSARKPCASGLGRARACSVPTPPSDVPDGQLCPIALAPRLEWFVRGRVVREGCGSRAGRRRSGWRRLPAALRRLAAHPGYGCPAAAARGRVTSRCRRTAATATSQMASRTKSAWGANPTSPPPIGRRPAGARRGPATRGAGRRAWTPGSCPPRGRPRAWAGAGTPCSPGP